MRHRLRLLAAVSALSALTSVVAVPDDAPSAAAAGATRGHAWVVAYSSNGGSTTGTLTAWQSNGGTATVTRPAPGQWHVRLGGFSSGGGNVQLTQFVANEANGSGLAYCALEGWYPDGTDQLVKVRCWEPNGSPAHDAAFGVMFNNSTTTPSFSYAAFWQNSGNWIGTVRPPTAWQMGASPQLTRTGVGRYSVVYQGAITNPFPLVTAWATSPRVCNVADWYTTPALTAVPSSTVVRIACFDFAGSPADTPFSFLLSARAPLGVGTTGGSLYAAKPSSAPVTPSANNINTRFGAAQPLNSHRLVPQYSTILTIPGFTSPDPTVMQTIESVGVDGARCYAEYVPLFDVGTAQVVATCFPPTGASVAHSVLGGVWDLDG